MAAGDGGTVRRVTAVTAGLIAAGIEPGDRIGLMSATSLDWVVCDLAIWAAGAVTVPVYETSSVEQIRWILADSGAVAVFAGDARCAGGIAAARAAKAGTVWQFGGGGLEALARTGEGVAAWDIDRRRGAVTAVTLATIVYTSGTTGRPKGCMISHGNRAEAVRAITGVPGVRERVLTEGSSSLFFLPLSHILARVVVLCLVHAGKRTGFLSDPGELPAELAAFRPTILLAVFCRLVYARLRAGLGGQAAWAISGGAPLNQELGHFLRGAGITIMEGWGLTETTGPVTTNRPAVQRIGSVGLPLPGCAVRIAPDGEVEVQGPVVFQGYWHDPQATTEVFDGRWLRTGDLGRCDDDGFLSPRVYCRSSIRWLTSSVLHSEPRGT